MQSTPVGSGGVTPRVLILTVIFCLLGGLASGLMSTCEPFLVLGMMLLLGLPHGATDHGLFLALRKDKPTGKKINFYLAYLGVIAGYGLIWYTVPLLAFTIFMLLSVYHFGQSNWVDVKHPNGFLARMHYIMWGVGILLTPILLHGGEAVAIVATMTDTVIGLPGQQSILWFIGLMAIANLIIMLAMAIAGRISSARLGKEVLGYGVLLLLFFTNSLLLGFTVYFVLWHSLTSIKDQLRFFQRRLSPLLRRQLYGEISMTVVGAFTFCLILWFGPGPEAALQPYIIGGVFIFISLLTLPHMLLVEQLYVNWSPVANEGEEVFPSIKNTLIITSQPPTDDDVVSELTITH